MTDRLLFQGYVRLYPSEPVHGQLARRLAGERRLAAMLARVDEDGRPREERTA